MAPSATSGFRGTWRITSMELWDQAYMDLEGPAHITFDADRLGSFQFGAVRGWIDYRVSTEDGRVRVEFSWEGVSEGDPLCGRGWAVQVNDAIEGLLFIHNGDESRFTAIRSRPARRRSGSPARGV